MRFFLLVVLVILIIGAWGYAYETGPPAEDTAFVDFIINEGEDVHTIGKRLEESGLIRSPLLFTYHLRRREAESMVQAGSYRLAKNYDLATVIDSLLSGVDPKTSRVTLIEGWTNKEYQVYLVRKGFDGDVFDELVRDVARWKAQYQFLEDVPQNSTIEGYLFPDTYATAADKNVEQLIVKMLNNFQKKLSPQLQEDIDTSGFSLHEIIILASIIEREVAHSKDRRIISDIFRKRLKEDVGLQSDATINYITGSGRTQSTAEDLQIDSPYNTYKYRGLPPGPIGNPGLDAIEAAIYPEANDYFYFLTDRDGNVHYAKTFEEHQRNRERYL